MSALHAWIEALEGDRDLDDLHCAFANASKRSIASKRIYARLRRRAESPRTCSPGDGLADAMEAINHRLYQELREELRDGRGGERLLAWSAEHGDVDAEGYDHLDDLLAGVLPFAPPGDDAGQPR